jgi:hypothetical protein
MAVDNTGIISLSQVSIVLFKFPKDTLKDVKPEKIIQLLNERSLKSGGESPVDGFTDVKASRIGKRDEILIEYLIEAPVSQRTVQILPTGELDWTQNVFYAPKILHAHIRPGSGIIEFYTSDKRFINRLLTEIRDCLSPVRELEIEKFGFSEEILEHILSKNEELIRVKFDQLDHTYLKEIVLKGDLLEASEEFKYYRTQKNAKFNDFHMKFYTRDGTPLSLVINRFGNLRFFRSASELTWEMIEEFIDELEQFL